MTHQGRKLHLEPLTEADLELVWEAEKRAYSHPWSLGNFRDALKANYPSYLLVAQPQPSDTSRRTSTGHILLGYWIAMLGVEEAHLLNIAVLPEHRRQGWAVWMLESLAAWAGAQQAQWIWLEVRASNQAAQQLYRQFGFAPVGNRKAYYPAGQGHREDAVVMSLNLKLRAVQCQQPIGVANKRTEHESTK
ncbi:MAG: hypothetical protein RLZZ612_681 [Pseudomonadota bacterium]|jgi:ribosomal-protein-alanine N-acetyltransferase